MAGFGVSTEVLAASTLKPAPIKNKLTNYDQQRSWRRGDIAGIFQSRRCGVCLGQAALDVRNVCFGEADRPPFACECKFQFGPV
jgi:hypothetical protein